MMRRVAIIGLGRVGGALALALQAGGDEIVAVAGRAGTAAALATRAADLAPDAEVRDLPTVARDAELVLVTTPDGAIEDVVRTVARADGVVAGQRWVHTAGGLALAPLAAVAAAGGRIAACHPAMTFASAEAGVEAMVGASWAVTAEEADLGWARVLVADLKGSPVTIPAASRTLYHAGLAVGSNATTAVVTMARDLLLGAGVHNPEAFLTPLVTTSARGGAEHGVDALTGPVSRGDDGTVRAHLSQLREVFPELVDVYVTLAELMLAQAVRRGLDPARAEAVRRSLHGHDPPSGDA